MAGNEKCWLPYRERNFASREDSPGIALGDNRLKNTCADHSTPIRSRTQEENSEYFDFSDFLARRASRLMSIGRRSDCSKSDGVPHSPAIFDTVHRCWDFALVATTTFGKFAEGFSVRLPSGRGVWAASRAGDRIGIQKNIFPPD